ncbi:tyrosyl-tRNA synthetase [Chthoniobacter flavus Ellin428]|uniref:Tyrosine--tRNA ligase n=1 Tax=Chthoniobacter flavus Ellin428 TaxID=497964 RepID=B4D0P4_9BACT|nr:tyrosine--tRNA ligase [Chthoniobacter flavus]EDY19906.1 tyrosyl-tRNA synthetase [Chthoniobacter flavus Ellin428]TCO91823.1 tyrosyl-tRNA synthetase [Chthoniobacter flavus]
MQSPEAQLEILKRGAAQIINEAELLAKLRLGRPLNVKLGVDPTAPDIHLGFTVALTKLRQFQDLGHQAILIIGDFTAMIGDPSGRSKARPQLTHDQVMNNARSFQEQAYKILDPERTRTVFNGQWFEMMTFEEVIKLNGRVTLQQMLQREDFKNRLERGDAVHLHEIQYPIMQGWDSVVVKADVEIGGTDQLFNILVGRDLQREEGQPQQIVFLMPLLEGLDGVQKMSKSLGNYVGVSEAPTEMFGKLMSITDTLMARYYLLLLGEDVPDIHPMDAKKQLARRIVARYHGEEAGNAALEDFNTKFSKRDVENAEWPVVDFAGVNQDIVSIVVAGYEKGYQIAKSRGDARRLVEQGSIQLHEEKITDPKATPTLAAGTVLKLDKKRAVRVG